MKEDLRARLKADATVAGIVGTRVDWDARPQGKVLPAVTLSVVVGDRDRHMGGVQTTLRTMVQADCWADNAKESHELADAVCAATESGGDQGDTRFLDATTNVFSGAVADTDTGQVYHQIVRIDLFHTPIP